MGSNKVIALIWKLWSLHSDLYAGHASAERTERDDSVSKRNRAKRQKKFLLLMLLWSVWVSHYCVCSTTFWLQKRREIQDEKIKLEYTTRKKTDRWPLLCQVLASLMFMLFRNEPYNKDKDIFLFFQHIFITISICLPLECLTLSLILWLLLQWYCSVSTISIVWEY